MKVPAWVKDEAVWGKGLIMAESGAVITGVSVLATGAPWQAAAAAAGASAVVTLLAYMRKSPIPHVPPVVEGAIEAAIGSAAKVPVPQAEQATTQVAPPASQK